MNLSETNLAGAAARADTGSPWWVIHTRPRCEKKMDEWFRRQGMEHYLPVRPKIRLYPGKQVTFHHPIFPGYAFASFDLRQRNDVYGSGYAAGILEVVHQTGFLTELASLRTALEAGAAVEGCVYLAVGQKARIVSGRLRGLEGKILRRSGKVKMILSVEMLQRSVAIEVAPEWLELMG